MMIKIMGYFKSLLSIELLNFSCEKVNEIRKQMKWNTNQIAHGVQTAADMRVMHVVFFVFFFFF